MKATVYSPVITIDGPSGVGKGTVGLWLALKLNWLFLDSGAIYRVLALAAQQAGIDDQDESRLVALANQLPLSFQISSQGVIVLLDSRDVSRAIREETISYSASRVAAWSSVRKALLDTQRRFRKYPGLVADGRDMGTVVFPDASLKFYLTAALEERAKRRQKQLLASGIDVKIPALIDELSKRDQRDQTRSQAPLIPAQDAKMMDTTHLSAEQVMDLIWKVVCQRFPQFIEEWTDP